MTKHIHYRKIFDSNETLTYCRERVSTPNDKDLVTFPNDSDCDFCKSEYKSEECKYRLLNGTSTLQDRLWIKKFLVSKIQNKYKGLPVLQQTLKAMENDLGSLKQELEALEGYKLPKLVVHQDIRYNRRWYVLWEDEV